MEAPTHVGEAGDVHVVERRGKVESSRAGLWFGGKGDRGAQNCNILWADNFLDHERKHNVTAKYDGRVGRGDCQHRNGAEGGILLVSEYVRQRRGWTICYRRAWGILKYTPREEVSQQRNRSVGDRWLCELVLATRKDEEGQRLGVWDDIAQGQVDLSEECGTSTNCCS